ncbi:MAG: sn-glycerol-1-phosphate dehydrogenase [bacterium]
MSIHDNIHIRKNAAAGLLDFLRAEGVSRAVVVADTTTFDVAGRSLAAELAGQGLETTEIVLEGEEVIADERYLVKLFSRAPLADCMFVAVGSGTITDITRFVSHRMKQPFVSYPTAASVDGFTSVGAPLILEGVKRTLICQAPSAIYADVEILRDAPAELTAAGFADMLAKVTSRADWKLGAELWNEPYDEAISARVREAVQQCLAAGQALASGDERGFATLMETLAESGLCMLDYGASRPASGAEHHMSHFWEMQLLREGRPAILHGAKVGVATALSAELYERIRSMSADDARRALATRTEPDIEADIASIREAYGPLAESVIAEHSPFLRMDVSEYREIASRIVEKWDLVQEIAAEVPPAREIRDAIAALGGPVHTSELALSAEAIDNGYRNGHFLRNRFTVVKLARMLGVHR